MPMARFPLTPCAVRGAEESPGQPLSKALLGDAKAVGPNLKNHEIIGSFAQVWECVAESKSVLPAPGLATAEMAYNADNASKVVKRRARLVNKREMFS